MAVNTTTHPSSSIGKLVGVCIDLLEEAVGIGDTGERECGNALTTVVLDNEQFKNCTYLVLLRENVQT